MTTAYPSPMQLTDAELLAMALAGPMHGDDRLPERFWVKTRVSPRSGCWVWTAARDKKGYAKFGVPSLPTSPRVAHRVAYSALITPLPEYKRGAPDAQQLDHLCRNTSCVNPSHLELVSPRVNAVRAEGVSAASARARLSTGRCVRGHTDWVLQRSGSRRFLCRTCERERRAERRKKLVAAAHSLGLSGNEYTAQYGWAQATAEAILAAGDPS